MAYGAMHQLQWLLSHGGWGVRDGNPWCLYTQIPITKNRVKLIEAMGSSNLPQLARKRHYYLQYYLANIVFPVAQHLIQCKQLAILFIFFKLYILCVVIHS